MTSKRKVLIANRGEIACRIIKALHSGGYQSGLIYAENDSKSLAVKMAL